MIGNEELVNDLLKRMGKLEDRAEKFISNDSMFAQNTTMLAQSVMNMSAVVGALAQLMIDKGIVKDEKELSSLIQKQYPQANGGKNGQQAKVKEEQGSVSKVQGTQQEEKEQGKEDREGKEETDTAKEKNGDSEEEKGSNQSSQNS